MRIGVLLLMFVSTLVFSQEESQDESFRSPASKSKSKVKRTRNYKNMVEFSRNGVDLSTGSRSQELTFGAVESNIDIATTNFKVNYARKITSNIWLQGIFSYSTIDYDYENTNVLGASFNDNDSSVTSFVGKAIYDFDTDPRSAFFASAGFSLSFTEDNRSPSLSGGNNDFQVNGFTLGFGKRFSLKPIGIPNASYTVSASYDVATGTLDNTTLLGQIDINETGFNLQLIEIDLFF